jgi:acyl-CoA thioesterase I
MQCKKTYLKSIVGELMKCWPGNKTINIACHGHSVPAGYFATPFVDSANAYPHLLYLGLKERFPFAVINVIVTAIGGEDSEKGAKRFERDVLCHRPSVVSIDYGLNDRSIGLAKAETAWRYMIGTALKNDIKLILMTPTWDISDNGSSGQNGTWHHAEQIRRLADEYGVGLADSYDAFSRYVDIFEDHTDLLSWVNHPNRKGHEIAASELLRWFPVEQC